MGKSPAKWIKTFLFGKKTAKSHSPKGRDALKALNDKQYAGRKGSASLAANSPVISGPVLVNTERIVTVQETGTGGSFNSIGVVAPSVLQDSSRQIITETSASNNSDKLKEELAAIKVQAAFRGFLARRAFRALKGIIRLQALIRGHLVRRQAIATLRATYGIIKLQALFRGCKVRHSGNGFEVNTKFNKRNAVSAKPVSQWKDKVSTNAFIRKLLSSSTGASALRIQFDERNPNHVLTWSRRWTSSYFWKPLPCPNKPLDLKSSTRKSNCVAETDSGRTKRSIKRNSSISSDMCVGNVASDSDKPKRNIRKISGAPADSVLENPQSELEKVKRSLRRVSILSMESPSDRMDVDNEKTTRSLARPSSGRIDLPELMNENNSKKLQKEDSSENLKDEILFVAEPKHGIKSPSNERTMQQIEAAVDKSFPEESGRSPSIGKQKEHSVMTEEQKLIEDHLISHDSQKTSKRASFSAKSEHPENGIQNTTPLPSYMAATESAKAKLRGQGSPRFSSDSDDKNGFTRRHSLPSSTNGKLSSHSPRTQKLVQASCKGSGRVDRSMTTSRDANERPIQVEWRR